ncbi:ABC transporter permease [Streptomyces uncialis]|uniref:ABC transporter permease n=1 Tax=Streptomyces uncialis TaxID=1048205 RepID=UPI00386E5646|nr:ABC transporter permease [Streptomyces uncialis]
MNAFLAELTKIRTVRSTAWCLAAAVAVAGVVAALIGRSFRGWREDPGSAGQPDADPLFASFYGLTLAQLALVVFAILVMGSEYSTGTIRLSLAATPHRGAFFAGKLLAVTAVLAVVSLLAVLVAFAAGQWGLGPDGVGWGAPGVPRAIAGSWLYLVLVPLLALGLTALLRGPARAMGALLPLLLLGSQGAGNIPAIRGWAQYLPDQAGTFIMHLAGPPEDPVFVRDYGPWTGTAILAAWTAAALGAGYLTLRRKDAV